jgi:hypothetical protein
MDDQGYHRGPDQRHIEKTLAEDLSDGLEDDASMSGTLGALKLV